MSFGRRADDGYVQITQGGGGQSLYELVDDFADWSAFAARRHGFTEYAVDGEFIRGTTYSVENEALALLPPGTVEVIDRFEIPARSAAQKARFASTAAKSLAPQNFDYEAMIRHTVERNRRHDAVGLAPRPA